MGALRNMQLGEEGFLRKIIRRRRLESVFWFVTSQCNSKCRACFYATETHPGADLTFDQVCRLADTAPRFDKLWLSGGEPILRDDMVDIIVRFYERCGIRTLNFPTNGLLVERVEAAVDQLLARCPELTVHLNYSLDGLGEMHDRLRGVPGSFDKTIAAIARTEQHFRGHPRVHQNVATVVTAENIDGLHDLGLYLLGRFNLATQFFETVRGESRDPTLRKASRAQLAELHDRLLPLYEAMAARLFASLPRGDANPGRDVLHRRDARAVPDPARQRRRPEALGHGLHRRRDHARGRP